MPFTHKMWGALRKGPRWTRTASVSMIAQRPPGASEKAVRVLNKLFGWWNGATIGTLVTVKSRGDHVGTDEFGELLSAPSAAAYPPRAAGCSGQ